MSAKQIAILGVLIPAAALAVGVAGAYLDTRIDAKTGPLKEAVDDLKKGQERMEDKLDQLLEKRR